MYEHLLNQLAAFKKELRLVGASLAMLDMLQGFAKKAVDGSYCLATIKVEGSVDLKASRHPVVEGFIGHESFIPNHISITQDKKQMLITGPNMAGKSTIMRQIALTAILNQIGSFVPASKAELPLFDRIFTRIGAADDLSMGQSTFMVEMSEAASILRQASNKSLVILDEVGRGTSTSDGLAIAAAILKDIHERLNCWTLFATHYHELVEVAEELKGILIMKTDVESSGDSLSFTHRLVPGASGRSYGIEVAKLAGVPRRVIQSAQGFLRNLQDEEPKEKPLNDSLPLEHWGFDEEMGHSKVGKDVLIRLEKVVIHRTTPLQALNILNDLKALADSGDQPDLFQQNK